MVISRTGEREIGAVQQKVFPVCVLEADVRNLVVSNVFISFLLSSEAVTSHDGSGWKFEDIGRLEGKNSKFPSIYKASPLDFETQIFLRR